MVSRRWVDSVRWMVTVTTNGCIMEEKAVVYVNVTREEMTGYEIAAPEFLPCATTEVDIYANHPPQFVNNRNSPQLNTTSSTQQAPSHSTQGKQLKVNDDACKVGLGYSSCNDIPLSKENIKNNNKPIQKNPKYAGDYEKGGYVQALEVFNPVSGEYLDAENSTASPQGAQGIAISNVAGTENPDVLQEENGYISPTPKEAPVNFDLGDTSGVTTGACENPYTATPKATRRELKRFDSELVDCDHGKDTLSPTLPDLTPFRNRLSTSLEEHYEDIDVYRNEKRKTLTDTVDAPQNSQTSAAPPKSDSMKVRILPRSTSQQSQRSHQSQRPSIQHDQTVRKNQSTAGGSITESPTTIPTTTTTAKQRRPPSHSPNLYTPIDMETPLVVTEPDDTKVKGGARRERGRQYCVLTSILLTLFFLVSVSLAISIAMLLMHGTKDNLPVESSGLPSYRINTTFLDVQHLLDNSDLFFELQSQFHTLKAENEALQETIQRQRNETEATLKDLIAHQKNISSKVSSLSSDFGNKIDNITSTLHAKGIDTLSSCSLKSATFTKLNGIHVETAFKPEKEELEDNFILFAFCTFIGMEDVNLDEQRSDSIVQYRCRCKASKKGLAYKSCSLYYWMCPRR